LCRHLCIVRQTANSFSAAFDILKPKGFVILSIEQHYELSKDNYYLQPNERFSHSAAYLNTALLAAAFIICSIEDVIPRMENGKAVDGALILVRKHEANIASHRQSIV